MFPATFVWWTRIDDQVVLGAIPFCTTVPKLHSEGIRAVVNVCEEYKGPVTTYAKYGIRQLHLPCIDFTSPRLEQIEKAVDFIESFANQGHRVYVHCKAGKGRSTTFVIAYLMKKYRMSPQQALRYILKKRPQVSRYLWRRPVLLEWARKHNIPVDI
jgi:atypical dual specificity phosphatase